VITEVQIYVEGGGDGKEGKALVRQSFGQFLNDLRNVARSRSIRWQIISCGPRNAAFRNFQYALRDHPDAFNILLVDAEAPVNDTPLRHLHHQAGWQTSGLVDEQCHLMVQVMEAWLIADIEMLKRFYGQGFNAKPIPNNPNVEAIPKQTIASALRAATHNTTKGEYHKIRHGPKLLEQLNVDSVRERATHCDRLFQILTQKMDMTN
jgi:hypothetical protein